MSKILKFGGTSMGSVEGLENVVKIIGENQSKNITQAVVCSAMSQVTNKLISIGKIASEGQTEEAYKLLDVIMKQHFDVAKHFDVEAEFDESTRKLWNKLKVLIRGITMLKEFSSRTYARLLSFGEQFSTRLLTVILCKNNINSTQYDSGFIATKGINLCNDDIDWKISQENIQKVFADLNCKDVPIITGFFGKDDEGLFSILGRGASDFVGSVMAVSLKFPVLEIWTDVDGFMSADPRIVPEASVIDEIGFEEASELCFFGAKVLHPQPISPVIEATNGEVFIKNTFNPHKKGTKIGLNIIHKSEDVLSISSKKVTMFSIDAFGENKKKDKIFAEIFKIAHEEKIMIDVIASSEAMISFCIESEILIDSNFTSRIEKVARSKNEEKGAICIVSPKEIQGQVGLAADIFRTIADEKISVNMYSQNSSEIAQLIVIDQKDKERAIRAIHHKFIG
jgi:aspartokinase/homoserine dehydrogenase 1